jgi:hypothetical protein
MQDARCRMQDARCRMQGGATISKHSYLNPKQILMTKIQREAYGKKIMAATVLNI